MCQLDILQRLKCERGVIHQALANLPRTLNEIYDRIVLIIPPEDQLFVGHALQWIRHFNEHHPGAKIPCTVLLQGVANTMALTAENFDRFYDIDTLKELCGCLISTSEVNATNGSGSRRLLAASFDDDHVLESLEAPCVADIPTDAAFKKDLRLLIMEAAFLEPYKTVPTDIWGLNSANLL